MYYLMSKCILTFLEGSVDDDCIHPFRYHCLPELHGDTYSTDKRHMNCMSKRKEERRKKEASKAIHTTNQCNTTCIHVYVCEVSPL